MVTGPSCCVDDLAWRRAMIHGRELAQVEADAAGVRMAEFDEYRQRGLPGSSRGLMLTEVAVDITQVAQRVSLAPPSAKVTPYLHCALVAGHRAAIVARNMVGAPKAIPRCGLPCPLPDILKELQRERAVRDRLIAMSVQGVVPANGIVRAGLTGPVADGDEPL